LDGSEIGCHGNWIIYQLNHNNGRIEFFWVCWTNR
jgi:hypothetical protein